MIETIKEFFAAFPVLAWSIVFVMIAMVVVVALWDKVKWWWLNTWMSFPLIGRIATLASKGPGDETENGWSQAEETLCKDYECFLPAKNQSDYKEKITYLTKAGDYGRTPMPTWIWVLTALLVFVEAMGFSYVLAGYTIPGASENLQQTGALGIAFIVSVLLVAFTHFAGHELYVTTQIKNAHRGWLGRKKKDKDGNQTAFRTHVINVEVAQSTDDSDSIPVQLANRVGEYGSYKITGFTILLVLLVAAGATYVRGEVLEKTLHDEVTGKSSQMEVTSLAGDGLDMSANGLENTSLPDADIAQNRAAKDKSVLDGVGIDRRGGWGTFIVLAFIFVFLQILGVIFGYKWGFAGQGSKIAYKAIGNGRYASYADVRRHFKEVADVAQAQLERLQLRLTHRDDEGGVHGTHTTMRFYDFIARSRQEEERAEDNEQKPNEDAEPLQEESTIQPSTRITTLAIPVTVEEAIKQFKSLQDRNSRLRYVNSLPQTLKDDVVSVLKAPKKSEEDGLAELEAVLGDEVLGDALGDAT